MYSFVTRGLASVYRTTQSLLTHIPIPTVVSSAILSTAALPLTMFAPTMPTLKGRFQTIGCSTFYVQQDPSTTSSPASPPLELVVKVFYPSSTSPPPSSSTFVPYMTSQQASAVASFAGVPSLLLSHVSHIRTRAVSSAPLPSNLPPLPILLYSHGLGGLPETYTVQACDLASRGYVVFMPTHNDHSASISILPTRTVAYQPAHGASEKSIRSAGLTRRVQELSWLMELLTGGKTRLPFEAAHLQTMLEQCDTQRVGLLGHSFGAATVMATAAWEQMRAKAEARPCRVAAVVSHDQWMLPVYDGIKDVRLTVPTLITVSQGFRDWDGNYSVLRALYRSFPSEVGSRMLLVKRSRHSNFSDVGLWTGAMIGRWSTHLGEIDYVKCWRLLDDYNALWFGRAMGWKEGPEVSASMLDEQHPPEDVEWLS